MDALSRPITPPAPKVHSKGLPDWRFAYEFGRNSLAVWAEGAFDELVLTGRPSASTPWC